MQCPRCREENSENSKVCTKCGLKLKISCPKCKSLNSVGQERCRICKLKLITFCPECKAPNFPNALNCRKCGRKLLVQCSDCKVLNPADRTKCIKCNSDLKEKQIEKIPEEKIEIAPVIKSAKLQEYAVLSVELINLSAVRAKIQNSDIVLKLRNFFFHVVELKAKKFKEESNVLSEQTAAISFVSQNNTKNSALYSIIAAQGILKEINELNFKIQNTLKIKLKVKIGISIVNTHNNEYYSQVERSAANADNVVVNTKVYNLTLDKFDFEIMSSVPVGDKLTTVYRLLDPLGINLTPEIIIEEPRIEFSGEEVISKPVEVPEIEKKEPEKLSGKREASQDNITGFLIKALTEVNEGYIIGISAPDGSGKTTVVSAAKQLLSGRNINFLIGQCQPINEIIPFAYFQDLLKNLFGLPPFITNVEESKKIISQFLLSELKIKDRRIEETLFNLLNMDDFQSDMDIVNNQKRVFECIKTIFASLKAVNNIALVIEDFEFIDSLSLECIKYFVDRGFLDEKSQIIVTHAPEVDLNSYFDIQNKDERIFDIYLKPMSKEEVDKMIRDILNGQDLIPPKLKDKIYDNSKGIPVYIEQALWLLFETGAIYSDNNILKFNIEAANLNLPDKVEDILKIRLTQLNKASADLTKILLSACMFGQRFMPSLLQTTVEMEEQQFINSLHSLESNGLFIQYDQYSLMFKNRIIYNLVYNQGFTEEEKINYHTVVLQVLSNYTKASSAMLAAHAELANLSNDAVNCWNLAKKEALLLGDIKSYTTAQQRLLSLLEVMDIPDKDNLKLSIYEEAGKINYEINPEEAILYLSNAILEREKRNEIVKIIELTGYLARSSELTGNYSGVIECVDKALSKVSKENNPIEYSLLNYCKLEAIYNTGKLEEAIYLAKNDILPTLKTAVSKNKTISGLSLEDLNYTEIETELILARAYAVQGNREALNIANALMLKANELGLIEIEIQAKLIEALYKTLQGEINSANAILEYLKPLISQMPDNNSIKLYWGFINLLSNILCGNFDAAKNIIDSIMAIAEGIKDYNLWAIIKLFEGKIYKESQNFEKAKTLYSDLVLYCSERKLAMGALFGWYLFAEVEIAETNVEKAQEIAERALEISQRAGINNYFLTMLLQRQLGEIQIIKGDFEAARMHVEQALMSARNLDLYLLQSKLFLTYGKIFQEIAAISGEDKQKNADLAHEYFMESLDIAQRLENEHMILQIEKEFTSLSTFCQLSGIII
ncbi:MAG: zinc ribbon domain-containing protein [Candidatus Gastranaerophilales bacterium]|nr:zinc ribbon domain-containing protein [Candidatus Gastranaerophilales bacterium]